MTKTRFEDVWSYKSERKQKFPTTTDRGERAEGTTELTVSYDTPGAAAIKITTTEFV